MELYDYFDGSDEEFIGGKRNDTIYVFCNEQTGTKLTILRK